MKLYQLTEHETSLLLWAITFTKCDSTTTPAEVRELSSLFMTIVKQHDLQTNPEEVQ